MLTTRQRSAQPQYVIKFVQRNGKRIPVSRQKFSKSLGQFVGPVEVKTASGWLPRSAAFSGR
jgi:hypothetical protein